MTQEAVYRVHSHKKTWENIRLEDGAKRYAMKYALKPYQKFPPRWMKLTGRFWGCDQETGKIDWSEFKTEPITESQLRTYLHFTGHQTKKYDVIPKILYNFD